MTEANGSPMDEKLLGFSFDDMRCLWWQWESPETGWYALDRPDEPDGPSEEFPMAFVFSRGAEGALNLKSAYESWSWHRAAWFWAPRGERFAFAVAGKMGTDRWRLRRLATHPIPPEESAIEIPSAPGIMVTWKLTRARMGKDTVPGEVIHEYDEQTQRTFRESPLPTKYPPLLGQSFRWTYQVARTGIFELREPPDGDIDLVYPDSEVTRTLALSTSQDTFQVAAAAGQKLNFSLAWPRIDSEVVVAMREIPRPNHLTPDKAIVLEGTRGVISLLHPDALGPADSPPGSFHPDRFPLWWRFDAPTDGRFAIEEAVVRPHSYTDVRQQPFSLTGRVQVRLPDPESVVATPSHSSPETEDPPEWPMSAGDTLWICASGPEIYVQWEWRHE